MQLKQFNSSFDGVRDKLKAIDGLVKEAGEHFNEAQQEKASTLLQDFYNASGDAFTQAKEQLAEAKAEPQETEPIPADEVDDSMTRDPQDGDVFIIRNGRPYPIVEDKQGSLARVLGDPSSEASLVSNGPVVVGQDGTQNGGEHDITKSALASLEEHTKGAKTTTGKVADAKHAPQPGVTTVETGDAADKDNGGVTVGLANSEGDEAIHHTEDGSRNITDAADAEGEKVLTADTQGQRPGVDNGGNDKSEAMKAAEGQGNGAHQFTESITADQPADTAAVQAGEQEVMPVTSKPEGESGVVVEKVLVEPAEPASALQEHTGLDSEAEPDPLSKTSGDGLDAGDWTATGMDASGFPVPKGSATDVSK